MLRTFAAVLEKFENELFKGDWSLEMARSALEFELFHKDEDSVYSLNFNRLEETFSITLVKFKHNNGDFEEDINIETFPTKLYNREFLTSRLVHYVGITIKEQEKKIRKAQLITRLINHDKDVYEDTIHELYVFAHEKGFGDIEEYYNSLSDETLNETAADYFETYTAI